MSVELQNYSSRCVKIKIIFILKFKPINLNVKNICYHIPHDQMLHIACANSSSIN